MTGLPEFNYPAFNAEAARLRALGLRVENPAENPLPAEAPWHQCMRAAIRQMLTCDTVALLPGWNTSRGANVEVELATHLKLEVVFASQIQEGEHLYSLRELDQLNQTQNAPSEVS
jgi:hypothetical protein